MNDWKHFIYMLTNKYKNVLYVGVTSDLTSRIDKHITGKTKGFAYKYNCFYLVYFEGYQYIEHAIKREKEIKGWRREKKVALINSFNSEWKFLNDEILNLQTN